LISDRKKCEKFVLPTSVPICTVNAPGGTGNKGLHPKTHKNLLVDEICTNNMDKPFLPAAL